MAQKKISDLPLKASAAGTDLVEITDVSSSTSKKTTVGGLATAVAAAIPAGAIKTTQLTIPTFRKEQTSASRTGYTGTAWTQLANGQSYTNSTSAAQTLQVSGSIMIHMTDSTTICRAALFVGTTKISNDAYHTQGTTWMRWSLEGSTTVAAGATVTFAWGIRTETTDGKFMEVANMTSSDAGQFAPTLQGIAVN